MAGDEPPRIVIEHKDRGVIERGVKGGASGCVGCVTFVVIAIVVIVILGALASHH